MFILDWGIEISAWGKLLASAVEELKRKLWKPPRTRVIQAQGQECWCEALDMPECYCL
jgi:hypothetical protein